MVTYLNDTCILAASILSSVAGGREVQKPTWPMEAIKVMSNWIWPPKGRVSQVGDCTLCQLIIPFSSDL